MKTRSYRDLVAWQKGMDLVVSVYQTTRCFPREETYGLTSQVRRAAVSIPSNIAEGQGRGSPKEFARFLRITQGSLQEMETQLLIAERLCFVSPVALAPVMASAAEVGRIVRGLTKSLPDADWTN